MLLLLLLQVVKDVALTISQAIGPVEKGVGKIQEKFHHISLKPGDKKEPQVAVEEHVTENVVDGKPAVAVNAEVEVQQKAQDRRGEEEGVQLKRTEKEGRLSHLRVPWWKMQRKREQVQEQAESKAEAVRGPDGEQG
jgi:hypothetical protein